MQLALCTISYRHHLRSFEDLLTFAATEQFDAMDVWGVHAKHLRADEITALQESTIQVSMLSHYVSFDAPLSVLLEQTKELSYLAQRIGTRRIRIFAGNKASHQLTEAERARLVYQLSGICKILDQNNQLVLLEIHPNTAADTIESTERLLREVNHPACRINFDVLHVVESGADPVSSYLRLEPIIEHLHLKSIARMDQFSVFAPENVYAASGTRDGMVPLFDGIVDYETFFSELGSILIHKTASLEWFGDAPDESVANDRRLIAKALTLRVPQFI
ncbi:MULTISPECIES: sugar phosphate isomerase/epimerase [Exiguobacterium]|uniref:sugar phosphate isomerase/epimerase family protein n=1 Tax=Exiguobacterium TaxID=33986 RepID=UPI00047E0EE7|nr:MULTISPECIES: TIM barrel protein [Exiguobacterium]MCT4780446.1 sugar phosphate isomerase/epimerase [Exiguobacterium soli]